jgi:hypothetical protein
MDEITLPRTGKAPLVFTGELVPGADVRGHSVNGRDANRWFDLAVYRTKSGRYVLSIDYKTCWQGELGHEFAEVLDDPAALKDELREYELGIPEIVQGYPPGDAYADKQARLLADVRRRFQAQVSELLGADPAFAERVE